MNLWNSVDLSATIKSYEYTKHTKYQIHRTIDSEDFRSMDSQTIFAFLSNKMEIVAFNDYLKRYLYQLSGMEEDFESIPDKVYQDAIARSFAENSAPCSFSKIKKVPTAIIHSWLKAESVKRTTIFVLGFGLKMPDQDVAEFLTKVNKEESFDFSNHQEAIYWFCYHNNERYAKAKELLDYYDSLVPMKEKNESLWQAMCHDPKMYIHNENELKVYLNYLKTHLSKEDQALEEFRKLYQRTCNLIASIHNDSCMIDGEEGNKTAADISPSDVENALYAIIPKSDDGNMVRMSTSLLSKQFRNKRMTRQHINYVLRGKRKPERFDMITMLFFLYCHNIFYDNKGEGPVERFRDYIDEINSILNSCNMIGIYPVNPYEAFILMCLVTEDPLAAYYDVWSYSFKQPN